MKSKLHLPSYLIYKRLLVEGTKLIALENENFQAITMNYAWQIAEIILHRDRKVTNKMRAFFRFTKYLVFLNKKNGALYVVKYLKASLLAIQRAIAGNPVSQLREIEPDFRLPRLTKGIPSIIGSRDRRAILAGSKSVIQFYLSIFALFRVIEAPVKPKLSTITDGFSGNLLFLQESLGFYYNVVNLIRCPKQMAKAKLLFLETSSPSNTLFSWQS